MKLHTLAAVCAMSLVASACRGGDGGEGASAPSTAAPTTPGCARHPTYIIVRHAEKATADVDTSLSERGQARATTLASMLAPRGVTRLIATEYKRTQETLAPLAHRLSLSVEVRPAARTAALLTELRAEPDGAVVVIATHSNILTLLVEQLGGKKLPGIVNDALPEDDYARIVSITQPCGADAPTVTEESSGE